MRVSHPTFLALLHLTTTFAQHFSPFSPVYQPPLALSSLAKRQNCGTGHQDCFPNGGAAACCATNQLCTLDNAGAVACCPQGSFCTGTLTTTPGPAPTLTSTVSGATVTSVGPITTAPTVVGPVGTYTPGQTITSEGYAFPVLWVQSADFGGEEQCSAAHSQCGAYYSDCTNRLQGNNNGFGVTVEAPGGGYTVSPSQGGVQNLGPDRATQVCGTLTALACPGDGATCGEPQPSQTGFIVVNPAGGAGRGRAMGSGAMMGLAGIVAWFVVAW